MHRAPDPARDLPRLRVLAVALSQPPGKKDGEITSICSLCPEDPHLTKVWLSCIVIHQELDDRIREDEMIRILTKAGYTVRKWQVRGIRLISTRV